MKYQHLTKIQRMADLFTAQALFFYVVWYFVFVVVFLNPYPANVENMVSS
jgi:hypothetical protein